MAFTTEFVMGAGGAVEVEEIPVSMSGSGNGTVHPLATIDAGTGAWVWVIGEKVGSSNPTLNVGVKSYQIAAGTTPVEGVGHFTGNVAISITTGGFGTVTFTGTVYVARM